MKNLNEGTSLPSCPVLLIDLQEKIYYNAINKFCACQQDSGLLFICVATVHLVLFGIIILHGT